MKKLAFLPFMILLLVGCVFNNGELTYSEINPEKTSERVKDFITQMEMDEDGTGNGIYIINDGKDKLYLYLTQEFLDKGNAFGAFDVKEEEDSINIYLNELSDQEMTDTAQRKLYKINRPKDYEHLRVFKNGEETYIQTAGA